MPRESGSLEAQPTRNKVRCLFIVARGQPDLWHHLKQDFAEEEVQVILDRRRGDRRQRVEAQEPERRRADRRRQPSIDNNLSYRSFVIVHEQQELLSG